MTWIIVERVGSSASGKTQRYEVWTKGRGAILGRIQWYPQWRRYCFAPAYPTVFEQDCLRDIADFLETATREYKEATK